MRIFILFFLILILFSCNATKQISKENSILYNNYIEFKGVEKDYINDFFYNGELYNNISQKPNFKILGFWPLGINIWAYYSTKKNNPFTQHMRTKIGKVPVLFDSTTIYKSEENLKNFYFNNGYFDCELSSKFQTKNKRTNVTYIIEPKDNYKYRNISYDTIEFYEKILFEDRKNSLLDSGNSFKINDLINERIRISEMFENIGYFKFNKNLIEFDLDTFKDIKVVDVKFKMLQTEDTNVYKKYYVDSLYVIINKSEIEKNDLYKSVSNNNIKIWQPEKYIVKPNFLFDFISNYDSVYSKKKVQQIINKFTDLNTFKLVNNSFIEAVNKPNHLITLLNLSSFKKHYVSFGQYLYSSSFGSLGSSISVNYNNRNLSRRADRLILALTAGLEFNFSLNSSDIYNKSTLISRSDLSLSSTYINDKLFIPFKVNYDNFLISRSIINSKISYEKRITLYDLYNFHNSFGFEWSKNEKKRYLYNPFILDFIYLPEGSITPEFLKYLKDNPSLKANFKDVIILGQNFQYSYFKTSRNKKSSTGIRINLETSGNTFYLTNKILNKDNKFSIFGIDMSQYVKTQAEYVYSYKFNKPTSMHLRTKFGLGLGYGFSDNLPYLKQFNLGGPYSLRGFPIRQIGPGTTDIRNIATKDQIGNLLFEQNFEYRFNIITQFKGALFVDMGNIWNTSSFIENDEKGMFKFNEFYKQFYISGGAGLRYDIDYIAIRFDFGFPLKVPYIEGPDSWVVTELKPLNSKWIRENLIFNIAIGYPF